MKEDPDTGRSTIDWKDPEAMRELTRVMLRHDFGIEWDVPLDRLCPPVANRLNYICWLADLMKLGEQSSGGVGGASGAVGVVGGSAVALGMNGGGFRSVSGGEGGGGEGAGQASGVVSDGTGVVTGAVAGGEEDVEGMMACEDEVSEALCGEIF